MLDYKDKHSENFQKALNSLEKDDREKLRKILDEDKTLFSEYSTSNEPSYHESESGRNKSGGERILQKNLVWFALKWQKIECLKLLIEKDANLEKVEKIEDKNTYKEESDFSIRISTSSDSKNKNFMTIAEECELNNELRQILFDYICDKGMVNIYKKFLLDNLGRLNIYKFNGKNFDFLNCGMSNSERNELKVLLQHKDYNIDSWRITDEDYYEDIIFKDFKPTPKELSFLIKVLDDAQIRKIYDKLSAMPQKPKDLIGILLSHRSLEDEKKRLADVEMEERNKKLFEQYKKKSEKEKKRKNMEDADSKDSPHKKQRIEDKKEKETLKKIIMNPQQGSQLNNNPAQIFFNTRTNLHSEKLDSEQDKKESYSTNNSGPQ